MGPQPRKTVYFLLAIIGLGVTWYFNLTFFLSAEDPSMSNFIKLTGTNLPSLSINADIAVASITFLFWMFVEGNRLKMKNLWVYFILTFLVAFAFSFPLFLYFRERKLETIK